MVASGTDFVPSNASARTTVRGPSVTRTVTFTMPSPLPDGATTASAGSTFTRAWPRARYASRSRATPAPSAFSVNGSPSLMSRNSRTSGGVIDGAPVTSTVPNVKCGPRRTSNVMVTSRGPGVRVYVARACR